MTEKLCENCKSCSPIISQIADHYCYKKDKYFDDLYSATPCDDFELDTQTMREKEEAVW